MIEFGESLRQAREARGYTVAQLAETTRMAPKTVTELESENFSHIAAPIYGRGFVKLYCEAVGLEAKPFIDEFMAIYRGERDVGIRERDVREAPTTEAPPVTAPEPPPAPGVPDLAALGDATLAQRDPPPPPPAAPEAPQAQPLSRYATPVRKERAPAISPAAWRIGVLAAAAILIVWAASLGVRALYRATSGDSARTAEAKPCDAPAAAPQEKPAEQAKEKPAEPAKTSPAEPAAPRAPQSIPSIYID